MAKGAPEVILNACSHVRLGNELIALDDRMRQQIIEYNEKLSAKALRVLAMAYKPGETSDMKQMSDFIFQGLVGMIDPPRAEVKEAIKICHQAGIRVIMITGDHPLTAKAIADEIGLSSTKVVTGMELDTLTDPEISELVENETVFARVSPEHKLTILRQLQKNKHLVAMTGDGVNDAPALKEANIGIAVGSGSDLAKEVSDMILLDDNFATIASAVEEGRGIFFNIRKFVKFLIAANFDEILVIFTSILFGTPLPFLPIHLLWLNLATDSLPALALSLDSYQKGIMRLKPYDPRKEIMHGVLKFSVVAGVLAYFATMGIFSYGYFIHHETIRMAQTMAFSTTVLFEFFIVFSCRSDISAFMAGIFSNKFLLASIAIGLAMQTFAVYFPYTHDVFKTIALDGEHAVEMVFAAASGFILIETFRGVKYAIAWKKQV